MSTEGAEPFKKIIREYNKIEGKPNFEEICSFKTFFIVFDCFI